MAEFAGEAQLSGMAREIRTATESEQYDLGGYTEQRTKDLIASAFSSPLTVPESMIRCTFIIGGGKLVRARYPDDLSRWIIGALRDVGFTEDRSAAETFDSQGTFKQQHDTGQNLKYVIVYPFVTCSKQTAGGESGESGVKEKDPTSPEYIVSSCEVSTFKDIVSSKFTSYKQKKRLQVYLQSKLEEFKSVEEKLMSGAQLSTEEQSLYDANQGNDEEKLTWLQSEIKATVDNGLLTQAEKEELITSIETNLTALQSDLDQAKAENKAKKIEKLEAKLAASKTRKDFVAKIQPITHRLRLGEEIQKLYMKLFPLRELEDKGRSMSLTIADLKTLEQKSDIEDSIRNLESASRGWFEDEEDFVSMCEREEREAKAKFAARGKKGSGKSQSGVKKLSAVAGSRGTGLSSGSTSKIGVGGAGGARKPQSSSNAKKPAAGGFSAMFDSDSD